MGVRLRMVSLPEIKSGHIGGAIRGLAANAATELCTSGFLKQSKDPACAA